MGITVSPDVDWVDGSNPTKPTQHNGIVTWKEPVFPIGMGVQLQIFPGYMVTLFDSLVSFRTISELLWVPDIH